MGPTISWWRIRSSRTLAYKKNWMFIGAADTGWRSAVVYTFVEQVRRHGLDPFAYFKWVFERLPGMTNQKDFAPLLPCNWAAAHIATEKVATQEQATAA